MFFRLNIPKWGYQEGRNGIWALLLFNGRGTRFSADLKRTLVEFVPGWEPFLLSSGRQAITLAARHLGLEGRKIAVPAYVCPAVLMALRSAQALPVPIDCEYESIRFNGNHLVQAVYRNIVDGVLAANTYGLDQDYGLLAQLRVPVIEDAAYQAGCRAGIDNQYCGFRSDAGVWSYNFKALAGVGGGILWLKKGVSISSSPGGCASAGLREVFWFFNLMLRSVGRNRIPRFLPGARNPPAEWDQGRATPLAKTNRSHMSELQSAVILAQWQSRDEIAAIQRYNSEVLADAVSESTSFSLMTDRVNTSVHFFPFLIKQHLRDESTSVAWVRKFLFDRGIQTESPYPFLWQNSTNFQNTRDLTSRLLIVPCNASIRKREIHYIARAITDASSILKQTGVSH